MAGAPPTSGLKFYFVARLTGLVKINSASVATGQKGACQKGAIDTMGEVGCMPKT
jgi:hypothetical protein